MWIISLTIIMAIITIILYKLIDLFDLAFFFGAIITVSLFFVTAAIVLFNRYQYKEGKR